MSINKSIDWLIDYESMTYSKLASRHYCPVSAYRYVIFSQILRTDNELASQRTCHVAEYDH